MPGETIDALTPREREILVMIAEGDSLPEIAQKLHRSLKTIESHRLSLGRKLDASNRVDLTHIAIAEGLISVKTNTLGKLPQASTSDLAATELAWLQQINAAVFNATGATFIKRFCDAASLLPGITIAAACTPDPTLAGAINPYQRYVIAMSNRGTSHDPIRYHATGTPCETIIKDGECCFSEGVAQAYPADAWLKELKAECYLGIQLLSEDGTACGGIGVIGCEPIANMDAYRNVLSFFAPRLAAELKLCLEFNALRTKCEQLQEAHDQANPDQADAMDPSSPEGLARSKSIAMKQISKDVQLLAGPTFLRGMIDNLCVRFGFKASGICMFAKDSNRTKVQTVMVSIDGTVSENFIYESDQTPCEVVFKDGFISIPSGVTQAFPCSEVLSNMRADGYVGIRLPDPLGNDVGILWVADTKEIEAPQVVEHVFRQFAQRVGAELSGFLHMEELLLEHENLKQELSLHKQAPQFET